MKLIKPSFTILSNVDGEAILKEMEIAARTCYKSEGKIEVSDTDMYHIGGHNYLSLSDFIVQKSVRENPKFSVSELCEANRVGAPVAISARKLIAKLIKRKHEAMLEFGGSITVKFVCDRGVSHELVRHRIASFAQESTRYCNYGKQHHISYIIPSWLDIPEGIYNYEDYSKITDVHARYWAECMYNTEHWYHEFISKHISNWAPQQARSVLPNSLKTEINVSANIREWRHIFKLRCAKAAHPQMRESMLPVLAEFKNRIPVLFDDIKLI